MILLRPECKIYKRRQGCFPATILKEDHAVLRTLIFREIERNRTEPGAPVADAREMATTQFKHSPPRPSFLPQIHTAAGGLPNGAHAHDTAAAEYIFLDRPDAPLACGKNPRVRAPRTRFERVVPAYVGLVFQFRWAFRERVSEAAATPGLHRDSPMAFAGLTV